MTTEPVYDLCVVGAGIAGLNALYVASQYLPASARVALIDQHDRAGGMWNEAYDYVRLHQPHPMFTAGDIPWQLSQPQSYLATRDEVQAHLAHCLTTISEAFSVEPYWGQQAVALEERDTEAGVVVDVSLKPTGDEGDPKHITAKQVIDARGLDIPQVGPLELSSTLVTSTAPQSLSDLDLEGRDVYVVGGGKTGMDTVLAVANRGTARSVTLIAGQGTLFTNRDLFFPTGIARHFGQTTNLKTFMDLAKRFDGTNADEVFEHFRRTYSISPDGRGEQFLFGVLSEDENRRIKAGTREIIYDYLQDVIETDSGPQLQFRSGDVRDIEAGSVFVNCTGYAFRADNVDAPVLSPRGNILSITPRASFNFLSTVSAYFLSHLFFSGQLTNVPIYFIDQNALFSKDRKVWHLAGSMQGLLNALLAAEALPIEVFQKFGLDFDLWHPMHKRLPGMIALRLNREKYIERCRRVLDHVAATYDVRCGPMMATQGET